MKAELVEAAWELVRQHGLAGLSLRDLGQAVGMRAQSVYSYFSAKTEIYDAMFRKGYEACIAATTPASATPATTSATASEPASDGRVDGERIATEAVLRFFDFCTADPVRYQLLFQRTIPDFVPSPESWAVAGEAYEQFAAQLRDAGIADQASLDLWTAVITGLTDQQISNDPGGHRWRDLVPRAVSMLLTELGTTREEPHDQ